MESNDIVITIDGPSGSGKSTVARALARRLGYRYLDTGAMYRAAALAVLEAGFDPVFPPDEGMVMGVLDARHLALDAGGRVCLDGHPVERRRLRTPEVDRAVSIVAALPAVRDRLTGLQRAFAARGGGLVAEGRDLGTVVFPRASIKFYLDADPTERARRRAREREEAGLGEGALDRVLAEQEARDRLDRRRERAPLRCAEGMIRVDTTRMTPEAVVELLLRKIHD